MAPGSTIGLRAVTGAKPSSGGDLVAPGVRLPAIAGDDRGSGVPGERQQRAAEGHEATRDESTKRLARGLELADHGIFMLYLSSGGRAQSILAFLRDAVAEARGAEVELVIYTPRPLSGYDTFSEEERAAKVFNPLRTWIDEARRKVDGPHSIFVIDGSDIEARDRTFLVDHFALMNGLRSYLASFPSGPCLIVVPERLRLEPDIGRYSDLMSCVRYASRTRP